MLFRGFLFCGWHRSPRDVWPLIIVTALLWAVVHLQYDPYVIAQVFAYGWVLGWLRWVTGSTILTMFLHGVINFEGMVETFVLCLISIPRPRSKVALDRFHRKRPGQHDLALSFCERRAAFRRAP